MLKKRLNRSWAGNSIINIILIFFGIFMVLPMVFTISASLKPLDEFWIFPPRFLPINPTTDNFADLMRYMGDSRVPFGRYIFNTVFVAVVGTFGHVILSSMCAYAFTKHNIPGGKAMFTMVVTALMFNTVVTQVPNFLLISKLGMMDTYWALIIPAFASPLGMYLMKQFMEQMVPDEILEAARIDGSSEMRMFFRIVMPMVKPAWLTLIIFSFQGLWNTGSTMYIYSEHLKTLNYALSQIVAGGIARTGVSAAATVVMLIVPILLFILVQSNVVETMSTSGMKG
ncbi:MAG: carbohydrate ABC transporter permease [Clostridiales bacterium]|nr:carbohydrate ABC transporter permease [Clostridiales bacterium]